MLINGVNIHSGFWRVVYTTKIHGGIINEVLNLMKKTDLDNWGTHYHIFLYAQ